MATDKTKYIFSNAEYGKGRLVLAVVKKYVTEYVPTYAELKEVFPSQLQGSVGVIISEEELSVKKESSNDSTERFFVKEDDALITSDNVKVYVSTEWGKPNINGFINKAQELGYDIKSIKNTLTVVLTAGAVRNGYIPIPAQQNLFLPQNIAENENDGHVTLFTLIDDKGEEFETCILKNKGAIKKRFNSYFKSRNIKEGTHINFHCCPVNFHSKAN